MSINGFKIAWLLSAGIIMHVTPTQYPPVRQNKPPTHPNQGSIIHVFVGHMGATTSVAFFLESQLLCFEKVFFLRLLAAV